VSWYYRSEVKGIQNWILSTSRLKDLRGGSAVIEALPGAAANLLSRLGLAPTRLQQAAGALFYEFASKEDLERFASEWPLEVHRKAPGLQVVQAWTETSKDPRDALNKHLAAARNAPRADLPEVGPWVARAGRSGLAALAPTNGPGMAERARRKRSADGTDMDRISDAKHAKHDDYQHLTQRCLGDLDIELKLDHQREGLIAVVHADGTGVGQRAIQAVAPNGTFSATAAKDFSEKLTQASTEALRSAIRDIAEKRKTSRLELQIVVLGGDDLTFICAADLALELTELWLRHFEIQTAKNLPAPAGSSSFRGLRAGAGIAVTSPRYPFRLAYDLAEELCATAKSAAKSSDGTPVASVLSLRRVTTSVDDTRLPQGVWAVGAPSADSRLPQVAQLCALRDNAKNLPRGSLRGWLTAIEEAFLAEAEQPTPSTDTPPLASKLWDRIAEIHPAAMKAMTEILDTLGATKSGIGPDLGLHPRRRWTPLRDALVLSTIDRRAEKNP
jgi:hypothetical protein